MLIKVASLNFSGINISPFEYHDGSQEKMHINSCFKRLLDNYHSENSSHYGNIAKLDLMFQKSRYTLLYRNNVGILRGKLVSREQFETIWDLIFQQNQENMKTILLNDCDVDMLKTFDRMLYQAFLEHVYGKVDWDKIKHLDATVYSEQLKKWHSKCYLKLDLKTRVVNDYLLKRDLDILFLQEAEVEHISKSLSESYTYVHSSKSMIILKKNIINKDDANLSFSEKFGQALNFNKDSAFIKLKNFLLVSAHLSSKKIKVEQAQNLKQTLQKILCQYPNLRIIVGIDANQYLQNIENFTIFPETHLNFTTRKRRTDMQLQFEKAGLVVQDVKDHIITNLKMMQTIVETIQCENINEALLPSEHHPFDHFAIFSHIIDENTINSQYISVGIQQKIIDAKSVSTCNSTKKSVNFKKYDEIAVPTIIISKCQEIATPTCILRNNEQDLKSSRDFSRSSKNSKTSGISKGSQRVHFQQSCINTLQFRQPSFGSRKNRDQKQKSSTKISALAFRPRESKRSKSVQKPCDKSKKLVSSHTNPVSILPNNHLKQQSKSPQAYLSSPHKKSCNKHNRT